MEDIKIKVWGIVSLNKKQILIFELFFLTLFLFLTVFLFSYDFKPHLDEITYSFHAKYTKYFSLACTFLIIIEAQYFWSQFTKAQLDIINEQKMELDKKKTRIEESIVYASKIQGVLLPSDNKLNRLFKEHFVLYKPRDIVSGDFYWAEQFDDKIIVAVADCTGHGVPGAFVSAMGVSLLNEVVLSSKKADSNINPADILSDLKRRLMYTVEASESKEGLNDGMDISVCVIDKKNKQFMYAGALMSVIHVKNLQEDSKPEISQIKPDINPLGMGGAFNNNYNYNSQLISFQDNDMLYLFSDGYKDQFGGEQSKKFMSKNFYKLLGKIAVNKVEEQLNELVIRFDNWKGKELQVDDITVLGIRL